MVAFRVAGLRQLETPLSNENPRGAGFLPKRVVSLGTFAARHLTTAVVMTDVVVIGAGISTLGASW